MGGIRSESHLTYTKEIFLKPAEESLIQRAYTSILEHFVQTGQALHFTKLAHILGVKPDDALDLQVQASKDGVG